MFPCMVQAQLFRQSQGMLAWIRLCPVLYICAVVLCLCCAKYVFPWMRSLWILRTAPKPPQKWAFSIMFEMWERMSRMDPSLKVTAKNYHISGIFNYLESKFDEIIDHDFTVVYFGLQPFLLGTTPDTVEAILTNSQNLNKPFLYNMLKPWVGTGILTSDKELWRTKRKAITPAFHFKILDDYVPVMNRRALQLVQRLRAQDLGEYIDALPVIRKAAFGILFETVLGVEIEEDEVERKGLLEVNDELGELFFSRVSQPWMWLDAVYNLTSESAEFSRCLSIIHTFTRKGHDTTAVGISWALYMIGLHQDVQDKIVEELDEIFGSDTERDATMEDVRRMKYLECVLKESLRLFPSVPLIGRELQEDWQYAGTNFPKGTICTIFIYSLHRDPKTFPKPEEFIPERFLPENCVGRHPFSYVPFSAGPRNCIGQKFALMEMKTLVSRVLRNYRLQSMYHRDKVQMVSELVLRSRNGLHIKISERQH
ncbi:cytochrome P450 4V2-like [Ornithodoros turicata]|uniref:cytochrome P450 4V2-like n=1 Tax=Ornithodoros turicata TaxID=34597 RepID=UPI00313933EB